MKIVETPSDLPNTAPIKEVMGVYIPNINENIPHRNGFIYTLIGSGGSGKTSLLLYPCLNHLVSTDPNLIIFI